MVTQALAAHDLARREASSTTPTISTSGGIIITTPIRRSRSPEPRGRRSGRGKQLRLQGRRVDAVGVQTLPNCLCLGHEARDVRVRDGDVGRGDGLPLVQPPDVQLVHRLDAGDLWESGGV